MNLIGMGPMEVLLVLLVAFIFLGPDRMVDAARLLGKAAREVRRLTAELPDFTLDAEGGNPTEAPIVHRGGGPNPAGAADSGDGSGTAIKPGAPQDEEASKDVEGPVAFRPAADDEPTPKQDA